MRYKFFGNNHLFQKNKYIYLYIQIEKDTCGRWAANLMHCLNWGTEAEIAEACYQLEHRLKPLKEKIIIEVLQNGTI